jgi:hypothetical protein
MKLHSFFKVSKESRSLSFGKRTPHNFNYVDFFDPKNIYLQNTAQLYKQMNDSYLLEINLAENYSDPVKELKLTNSGLITWEDYWIDAGRNIIVDPKIERLNLQKNQLIHANFNLPRFALKQLNLEGNLNMRSVHILETPNLEVLNISNCPAIDGVNLGVNGGLKALIARNCRLTSVGQERLLRDFRPTKTASMNTSFSMFRKNYETILDIRGSEVDWGNRRVASKIRLLLCNNWMVLWDNVPPASVVPPQMYAFFSNNLEDKLIKDYYG